MVYLCAVQLPPPLTQKNNCKLHSHYFIFICFPVIGYGGVKSTWFDLKRFMYGSSNDTSLLSFLS